MPMMISTEALKAINETPVDKEWEEILSGHGKTISFDGIFNGKLTKFGGIKIGGIYPFQFENGIRGRMKCTKIDEEEGIVFRAI